MTTDDILKIIAATVPLIGAIVGGVIAIINALHGHGTIVQANTEATNAQTAALTGPAAPPSAP